jgi:uncharacterized protein (TIGR02246 family)
VIKMTRLSLSVAAAVLATGVVSATAQAKDPALDKLVADWSAAFDRGDAKTLASHYTDNAIRVTPDGGTVLGRAAIEKEFAGHFAGPWKGATIQIRVGTVQPVGPDTAVAEGTYAVTPKGPDGKALPPVKGRYLNTMVKKSGAWVLSSNAAVLPAPPAQ